MLLSTVYCTGFAMWDAKRQFIWLVAGLALGTFVAYSDAHDEDGSLRSSFFRLHGKPGADNHCGAVLYVLKKEKRKKSDSKQ